MSRPIFRKQHCLIALVALLATTCAPAWSAQLPPDPQLLASLTRCVFAQWPQVTVDEIRYDPPLASIHYTPGPADAVTQYFVRTSDGRWRCVHGQTSPYLSPIKTWYTIEGEAAQVHTTLDAQQTADFVLHRRGRVYPIHAQVHLPSASPRSFPSPPRAGPFR